MRISYLSAGLCVLGLMNLNCKQEGRPAAQTASPPATAPADSSAQPAPVATARPGEVSAR